MSNDVLGNALVEAVIQAGQASAEAIQAAVGRIRANVVVPCGSTEPFLRIDLEVLVSRQWAGLTPKAVKLLLDMAGQLETVRNGALKATYRMMKKRGWHSKGSLFEALEELLSAGWLRRIIHGGGPHPAEYAITFLPMEIWNEAPLGDWRLKTDDPRP